MALEIESRFQKLQKLVNAAQLKGLDEEVAAYYCKLGCVLICGNLERCVEILIRDRVGNRSIPQIKTFLAAFFKRGTNYDCDEIKELLYKFDNNWGKLFEAYVHANDRIKTSITSAYSVRNSIAHGGGGSLGPKVLKQYYDDSFTLVVELQDLLHKN
ncbi:hypothetical protein IVA96_01740 [Bradyrhizobium sp. 159]|uniref:HEPN domain-containing protein n=1 Tax=Bradyrhizobium sp. 159 TaxID=2782632 RepID=UPI001FFB4764|nr:HEPN domain-containing protein [Bradyrhizobium sp. 159]MCK1615436.1 hypothetical protein [Bradyrhizobium sp. 159]